MAVAVNRHEYRYQECDGHQGDEKTQQRVEYKPTRFF